MYLFTKQTVTLLAELLSSNQLVMYYDTTGQLLKLPGCGIERYIGHSKL
eukprot:CAMPEP_0172316102 /NCGR_PEP_ID=MMETSP1058-20130122/27288_1 /TAXON_ID=83371 /ORGANISM="Detonula confervacea, Strain CCMP 353" /LENGTH=48 /DNA_ID= /DNA_START= /DNA_END= /DNA_ORIENTATION=